MSRPADSSRPVTNPAAIRPNRWIVYRAIPRGDLFIFAEVDVAVREDAFYCAISESRTWGEFRRRLPAGEWAAIAEHIFLDEDELEEEDRCHVEDDDAPFDRSRLPGVDDTGFPEVRSEWLGDAEDFPNALIKAYNEVLAASPYQSVHWQVPAELGETVVATLRDWGFVVERADFLEFC